MAVLSTRPLWILAVGALVLATGRCARAPTDLIIKDSDIQVHAFLRDGDDSVVVYVGRALPDAAIPRPVSGLDVTLVRGSDTLPLTERRLGDGPLCWSLGSEAVAGGCYEAAVPGAIRSGDHFEMRIRGGDSILIEGSVSIPHPPSILGPPADSVIDVVCAAAQGTCEAIEEAAAVGTFPLRWIPAPNIGRIQAVMEADSGTLNGSPARAGCHINLVDGALSAESQAGAAIVVIQRAGCRNQDADVVWDVLHGTLWVTGYDTAFARYRRIVDEDLSTSSAQDATANITGAHGFLAGLASRTVPLRIRR